MKKVMVLLSAVLLISGFLATAAMAIQPGGSQNKCLTCEGYVPTEDLQINRGCEGAQTSCYPFDYEGNGSYEYYEHGKSYCSKDVEHRAIFNICECIPPQDMETWNDIVVGEIVSIQLTLGVGPAIVRPEDALDWSESDVSTFDTQGVYWAENVNKNASVTCGNSGAIYFESFLGENQDLACSTNNPQKELCGPYAYLDAFGNTVTPYTGTNCFVPGRTTGGNGNRAVTITPDFNVPGTVPGYQILPSDNGLSAWAINIPEVRVDPSQVQRNQGVYVKITLFKNSEVAEGDSICTDPQGCDCYIYLGRLCCDSETPLVYPYYPPANSTYWGLLGMTLSNIDDADGLATITMYENDGDVGQIADLPLGANETYLNTLAGIVELMEQIDGDGSLGDSRSYIEVSTDFDAAGFTMIANPSTGESMGYLPIMK